jgi:hypothetical protein
LLAATTGATTSRKASSILPEKTEMIVASSLENVSSDWVAVELSAVAVVLPGCTCGREIAAYHRLVVSSYGEHGCVAWTCHAEEGGRQGRSWRDGHTHPLGKEDLQAAGGFFPYSWRGGHTRPLGNEGAVLGGACRLRAPGLARIRVQ